ncbi:LysR family transcriptional regulator [Marinomonas ushuaiensis DSM 15871]|uniref:LysR family transcriptional regulator n=1 Tax=Marinomonas ushuaiensis DSM 15871 TaxID=1122207 RepID=X7E6C8_9GAMM|nr:LysR family transcriptional regulator [Marinomonas ushuaiensis]ETX11502.1 LysR family transcriptional regulator [Marinomonas ushuaiensis DSM 15871]
MKPRRRYHAPSIYYFDAVYRLGSIREAARSLDIASSAVSRQIQKLEYDLGVQLFERLPKGIVLTAAGESFAQHVRLVLQDSERVYSELEALQGLQRGHIEILSVEGPTVELLPNLLEDFKQRYPNVSIGIRIAGSNSIPNDIIEGKADIGIVFDLERHPDLYQVKMGTFHFGAVVTPDHPLASKAQVTYEDCLPFPLILSKSDLSMYQKLASLKGKLPTSCSIIESSSVALSRNLALKGMGIAFQTKIGIESDIEQCRLVHIPIINRVQLISELGLYVRAKRTLPVAVDFLVREMANEIERLSLKHNDANLASV